MEQVPTNLTALRLNRGLSLTQAASDIGIARRTLERAELGIGIHPASAKKVADYYGLTVMQIWPVKDAA